MLLKKDTYLSAGKRRQRFEVQNEQKKNANIYRMVF